MESDTTKAVNQQDKKEPLPFPETDYSPGLQRTLKEKFDKGEIDTVDRGEFLKLLDRSAPPEEPDQAS